MLLVLLLLLFMHNRANRIKFYSFAILLAITLLANNNMVKATDKMRARY